MRRDRDGPRRLVRVPGSGDDSTLMSAPQATIRGPMMKRERGPSRQQISSTFAGIRPGVTTRRTLWEPYPHRDQSANVTTFRVSTLAFPASP